MNAGGLVLVHRSRPRPRISGYFENEDEEEDENDEAADI